MVLIKPILLALGICVTLSQGAPAKSKKQKIQVTSFDSVEKSSEELENLPEILPMVMYDESGPQDHPVLKQDSLEEPPVPVLSEAKPSRSRKAPKKSSKKTKKQKEEQSDEDEAEEESRPRPYGHDERGPRPYADDGPGPRPYADDGPGPRPYADEEEDDDEGKSIDEEQEDEEDEDEEEEEEAEAEDVEAEAEDDEAVEDAPAPKSTKSKSGKPPKSHKKKINYKQAGSGSGSGRPASSTSTKTSQKERGALVVHDDDPHKKHYPTVPDYRPYDHQSFQRPVGGGGFEGIGSYFSGLLSTFTGGAGHGGGYGHDHGYGGHGGYGGYGSQGNHGGHPTGQSGFLGYGHGNFQQGSKNAGPVPGGKPTYHHGFYTSHY